MIVVSVRLVSTDASMGRARLMSNVIRESNRTFVIVLATVNRLCLPCN